MVKNLILNIIGFAVGLFSGAYVNGYLISISHHIIPPPKGANLHTFEGLQKAMEIMEPKHFLMPFLAHAIGTFIAAAVCVSIARTYLLNLAFTLGFLFLIGGIYMIYLLPSPIWFNLLDLAFAYLPMAYFGAYFILRRFKI
jgi:hypothetical protein